MVLIKTVAAIKREKDIEDVKEELASNIENLNKTIADMDDLRRLKTICRNIEKLTAGKRIATEAELEKRRERNKIAYVNNKDQILAQQRESRKRLRELKEDFEEGVKATVDSKINKDS